MGHLWPSEPAHFRTGGLAGADGSPGVCGRANCGSRAGPNTAQQVSPLPIQVYALGLAVYAVYG